MEPLLAKPHREGRRDKTLLEHTADVVAAAERLYGTTGQPTRLGRCWLRFFRLNESECSRFHSALLASCLFHDWGKANADMQGFFHGHTGGGQLFHHEHLSVLMLGYPAVRRWVEQRSDIPWDIVLAAVGSHHLRFTHEGFADVSHDRPVQMFAASDDFRTGLVGETAARLRLSGTPSFPCEPYWGLVREPMTFHVKKLREEVKRGLHRVKPSPLLHAVRAALIAADAVGSGLPRTGENIDDWIAERMNESLVCDPTQIQRIVDRRIAAVAPAGGWKWNEFQNVSETLPDRTLMLAPCGSGKTLAAWRWILGRVRQRPVKRVLFLYPTRATATEGFKDYVSWAPEGDAGLLHGTAGYDLDGMFEPSDPRSMRDYGGTDPRLFALRHWSKRVFSATVDQFFAFMSYGYGPMCLLPLLADSVIVVDEVHSFDTKMFSALLAFLKAFDVPVLCMTATMQKGRLDQLGPLMGEVYGYDRQPADLAELAGMERYVVKRLTTDPCGAVREAIRKGKRVLWVVNQVSRAQAAAAQLAAEGVRAICYHSRFTLNDRVKRHQETVAAIRAQMPAAVAVSTQVCEMSLDIDADVLITEACPITSLIQRMGRCRRGRRELAAKGPGEVFVYFPDDEKVYDKDDLAGVVEFLNWMAEMKAVSQTQLEEGLDRFGPKTRDGQRVSQFLDGGAYADGKEDTYRDIEAFNVQAVLSDRVDEYLQAQREQQPGFIVPVPRKLKPPTHSKLPSWLFVADARHYHPLTGFHDTPLV